jgi:hypothetical protein
MNALLQLISGNVEELPAVEMWKGSRNSRYARRA